MNNPISEEDVYRVAQDLSFLVSEEQVKEILERYPSAQEDDPTGTWDLVVEQLLNELEVPKAKYFFREFKERNGEYEYYHASTMKAASEEEAKETVYDIIKDFYGGGSYQWDDNSTKEDGWFHNGGEVFVELYTLTEVTKEEYDVLKKYIH